MLRKLSPLFLSLLSLSCKFHACVSLDNIFIDMSHDTGTGFGGGPSTA